MSIEEQYIDLLKKVLKAPKKDNRTDVKTLSVFGERLVHDFKYNFPLITTKRVFYRGVVEELLWFLKGSSDVKELQKKKIHIWDGNSTKEFYEKNGIDLPEFNIGEGYGYQWRTWNGEIDQITNVVEQIKNNPHSRRHVVTAWNPSSMNKCALPPCHILFQFNVDGDKLDLQMYQRSADLFLGVPFNIASYALLLMLICKETSYSPGKLILVFGDSHIYENHIKAVEKQIVRDPKEFCEVKINCTLKQCLDGEAKYEDFELKNYKNYGTIKAEMVV